ncbi:hypothetical protein ACOME3_003273 [Neoechinorhynchus agilis]
MTSRRSNTKTAAEIIAEQHQSKYRHTYGFHRRELGFYKEINISLSAQGTNACDVNGAFLAVVLENTGGGSFVVVNLNHTGRVGVESPRITGHRAPVSDVKFNPFIANQIASGSDDGFIRIWNIPRCGLVENIHDPVAKMGEHSRRVSYVRWNPVAAGVLASAGLDRCVRLWNCSSSSSSLRYNNFPQNIHSLEWSFDGRLLVTTCNDGKIRFIDPRSNETAVQTEGHSGSSKPSKALFLSDNRTIFSSGFSKIGSRQMALWDMRDMGESLAVDMIDQGNGILFPYYDPDLDIVYLIGKGDGNFRYYEIIRHEPYFFYLSEYVSNQPQHGYAAMPKLDLDHKQNEIARFYKLHGSGICEPISMIVPRRSGLFQADLFPDTHDLRKPLISDPLVWFKSSELTERYRTPINQLNLPVPMIDLVEPKLRTASTTLPFPAMGPVNDDGFKDGTLVSSPSKIQTTFVPLPAHLLNSSAAASAAGACDSGVQRWSIERGVDESPCKTVHELRQELSRRTQVGSFPIMRSIRPRSKDIRVSELVVKSEQEPKRQEKERCVVVDRRLWEQPKDQPPPTGAIVSLPPSQPCNMKRRKVFGEEAFTKIWTELTQHERRLRLLEHKMKDQ